MLVLCIYNHNYNKNKDFITRGCLLDNW